MTVLPERIKSELEPEIDGEVSISPSVRAIYANAACIYSIMPTAVARPKTASDVAKIVAYAASVGVPVTPRGGGSGVAGHSIGSGIVIDFSSNMTSVIADGDDWVEVEPGITLDDLNRHLAQRGKHFAPDPSSGAYCAIGGMIANNSSGAKGIARGSTRDHIISLEFADAEGHIHDTSKPDAWIDSLTKGLSEIVRDNRAEIESRRPKVTKTSSGYNLWGISNEGRADPMKVIVGSEGTLAVVTKARLKLSTLPSHRGAALLRFRDLRSAAAAVPALRETKPAAIEIMDSAFLAIVKSVRSDLADIIGEPGESLLLVEYEADDKAEVDSKLAAIGDMTSRLGSTGANVSADPRGIARLWSTRKAGSPIISSARGSRRPLRFVEDVVVPPERFAEFAGRFMQILDRRGCSAPVIGHAGDGNIHVNPIIDLKDPNFLDKIRAVADEVYELVGRFDGSLTGEHGDGRLRAPYLEAHFGKAVYSAFVKLKSLFDPKGILNPGVKIGTGAITDNVKLGRPKAITGFSLDEASVTEATNRCHGCGDCRDDCPAYGVLHTEENSPRGRVNMARALINGDLAPEAALADPKFVGAVAACLGCGRCEAGCSSGIDIPGLVSHLKGTIKGEGFRALRDGILKNPRRAFWILSRIAPVAAPLMKLPGAAQAAARILGLNPDAPMPVIESEGLKRDAKKYTVDLKSADVIYFPGCYATFLNPAGVGMVVPALLEKLGFKPGIATFGCCGLPMYSSGNRAGAAEAQRTTVAELASVPDKPIVTSCPSCKRMMTSVEFDDSPKKTEVAHRMISAERFILGELKKRADEMKPMNMKIAYQTPCHQRGSSDRDITLEMLRAIRGLDIVELPDECCGMGGEAGRVAENRESNAAVAKKFFDALDKSGAELAVTPCGSCAISLSRRINTVHPLLLVARALQLSF